jgi:GNAT superfamily N-acetyltransferase
MVKELIPDLLDEYLKFFDTAIIDFPYLAGCYCGFYETTGETRDPSPAAGPGHRAEKADRIRSGQSHGLMAFVDGKVVGWCNAQPRSSFDNMRRYATAVDDPSDPVGSIMCFLVAPRHRGRGVGRALLHAACDTFRRDGLRTAEGYPTTSRSNPEWKIPWAEENCKGSLSMYLKAGFKVHRQLERFAVVRKQL